MKYVSQSTHALSIGGVLIKGEEGENGYEFDLDGVHLPHHIIAAHGLKRIDEVAAPRRARVAAPAKAPSESEQE